MGATKVTLKIRKPKQDIDAQKAAKISMVPKEIKPNSINLNS